MKKFFAIIMTICLMTTALCAMTKDVTNIKKKIEYGVRYTYDRQQK